MNKLIKLKRGVFLIYIYIYIYIYLVNCGLIIKKKCSDFLFLYFLDQHGTLIFIKLKKKKKKKS